MFVQKLTQHKLTRVGVDTWRIEFMTIIILYYRILWKTLSREREVNVADESLA